MRNKLPLHKWNNKPCKMTFYITVHAVLIPSLYYSAITTLTSRMDKLETDVESFKSVRLRRHHHPMPVTTAIPSNTTPSLSIEGNHTPSFQRK